MRTLSLNERSPIQLFCYTNRSVSGENFIAEHAFVFQLAGSLTVTDGPQSEVFAEGDFRFSVRNKLAKFVKYPPVQGDYKSLSIAFDQATLRDFSREYGIRTTPKPVTFSVIKLKPHPRYKHLVDSLLPYLPFSPIKDDALVQLKRKEALLTLVKVQPELAGILFDFSEPTKLDLAAFMEQNYRFNLKLPRFAYLTGRSLSAFKRDFASVYQAKPGKWLVQKRLYEAYYLMKEKRCKPSDIYVEVGFEDLSHFSYAFKKQFGVAPSTLLE